MKRGFYFETKNNKYFYNDITGYVECCNDDENTGIVYGKFVEHSKCSKDQVEAFLKNNGFKQLILMITQDCNMRCKYCAYSGEYSNQREHTRMRMTYDVAKKAIDKYYEEYIEIKRKNILLQATIGFYGGEPLLEMDLIKQTVPYIRKLFNDDVNILITTNGTLINEDVAKFLINNRILLTVSLNGDKKENDRMRVYSNGKGTYDDIYKNFMLIKKMDEKYYRENVTLSGVLDIGTNLVELNKFYEENDEFPNFARNSMVSGDFTDWYDRYTKEEKELYEKNRKELFDSYKNKMINREKFTASKIERSICIQEYLQIINRMQGIDLESVQNPLLRYTGMCMPGTKVAIAPDGQIHCCEKINLEKPFGDVDNWLNYDAIVDMVNEYNKVMTPNCSKCPIQRLCNVCFSACLNDEGKFTLENIGDCSNHIDITRQKFVEVYELMEQGVDMNFDKFVGGVY